MRNKWKTVFWIMMVSFVITILSMTYVIIDQSYTITYMKEGYEDTEFDLMQIAGAIKGRLSKSDFTELLKRDPERIESNRLELNRIKITFDKTDKVDSITTNW